MKVTSEKKFCRAIELGRLKDAKEYMAIRELRGLKDNEVTCRLLKKLCIAYCKKEKYNDARELVWNASARHKPALSLEIYDFSVKAHDLVFNNS